MPKAKYSNKTVAAAVVLTMLILGGGVYAAYHFGFLNFNIGGGGTPVMTLVGQVIDTPDSGVISGATVDAYADAACTQLLGTDATDSSGIFEINGVFASGQVVYLQARLADYYPSNLVAVTIPEPNIEGKAPVGQLILTDMYTSTDVTLSITAFNGTAITGGANVTGATLTGLTLRCTGIAAGEAMGTPDRAITYFGYEKADIVTGVVIAITVTGGVPSWGTAPDYTVAVGSTAVYIWIAKGEANDTSDLLDGIWVFNIAVTNMPSSISDIDINIYADGDNLDNTIRLSDCAAAALSGYTAAETIANIDII